MSIEEENKALIRRLYELENQRDWAAAHALIDPSCVMHMPAVDLNGAEYRQFEEMFWAAFPDMVVTIINMVAEGDLVAYRVNMRGTHLAPFMGHAATGKRIDLTNFNLQRLRDGKIVEVWVTSDRLSLMQQLGLISETI